MKLEKNVLIQMSPKFIAPSYTRKCDDEKKKDSYSIEN
jgi:hypothetical protein